MSGPDAVGGPVLVVDDDTAMRETLQEVLAVGGYPSIGAGSASEAKAQQAAAHPALAIIDHRLPDATGVDLADALRATDPDLGVIILTGYATMESAIAAVSRADGYLTKPVAPDQLLRDVESVLDRRRLRRENRELVTRLRDLNASLEQRVAERTSELTQVVRRLQEVTSDLVRREEQFRSLVELAPDAIIITGGDGSIVLVNAQTEKLFGYDRADLLGRPVSDLLLADRDDTSWGRTSSGAQFPVDVSRSPLQTEDGDPLIAAIVRDASDRHNAEHALRLEAESERETADQLRQLDRMKDDFLATVSHELRTPLTAIAGFSALLRSRPGGVKDMTPADLAARILVHAEEMTRMVEQLLDFTRLEAGRVHLDLHPVNVAAAVTTATESISILADQHEIIVAVPGDLAVLGDPDAINRVLTNFVDNAAKFSPPGSPIRVEAEAQDDEVVIRVVDQGPGIAAHDQAHLFDRYYQAAPNATGRRGAGLGLAIAQKYATVQHGRVWVESTVGEGSVFAVALARA